MRRSALGLALVLAVTPATIANAGMMEIDYAVSSVLSRGGVPIGPGTGAFKLRYTAGGGALSGSTGNVLHGPVTFVSGTIMGPFSFTVAGDLILGYRTGTLATGTGILASNGMFTGMAMGVIMGVVHCSGATCGTTPPPSVTIPFSVPVSPSFVGTAATTGSSLLPTFTIMATTGLGTLLGAPLSATYTISEVAASRHFIPEPSTLPMLGLGLTALAVATRWGRRIRR